MVEGVLVSGGSVLRGYFPNRRTAGSRLAGLSKRW